MSVRSALEKSRRCRTPVLPVSAVTAYVLVGVERLFVTYLVLTWPIQFDPRTYHWLRDFFWDGTPETLMWIHVLVVIFLWCSWRGWLATHSRDVRSARGAWLAFLVPALVVAMFSWAYFRMELPRMEYSIEKIEIEHPASRP